jgi:hypothetical protein
MYVSAETFDGREGTTVGILELWREALGAGD